MRYHTISIRVQALTIFLLIAIWHGVLFGTRDQGENAPVLLQAVQMLLPLLTTLLVVIVLETRLRHHQRGPWWVYLSVPVGLLPWLWFYVAVNR
jgi:hypothetical protein